MGRTVGAVVLRGDGLSVLIERMPEGLRVEALATDRLAAWLLDPGEMVRLLDAMQIAG